MRGYKLQAEDWKRECLKQRQRAENAENSVTDLVSELRYMTELYEAQAARPKRGNIKDAHAAIARATTPRH